MANKSRSKGRGSRGKAPVLPPKKKGKAPVLPPKNPAGGSSGTGKGK
jgi:hypothetical protein